MVLCKQARRYCAGVWSFIQVSLHWCGLEPCRQVPQPCHSPVWLWDTSSPTTQRSAAAGSVGKWMGIAVGLHECGRFDERVALGGGDGSMTEQFLDHPDIATGIENMRGE